MSSFLGVESLAFRLAVSGDLRRYSIPKWQSYLYWQLHGATQLVDASIDKLVVLFRIVLFVLSIFLLFPGVHPKWT